MRIRVPIEVALVLLAGVVLIWILLGSTHVAERLKRRFGQRRMQWIYRAVGAALAGGGAVMVATFLVEQDRRHPIYPGLVKFGLGEVVVATVLFALGALFWAWSRWRALAAGLAGAAGLAVLLKPFLFPLMSRAGSSGFYSLTSETHLYFLLSGGGLMAMAIILAFLARKARGGPESARPSMLPVVGSIGVGKPSPPRRPNLPG